MIFTSGTFLCPVCEGAHDGLPVKLTGFNGSEPVLVSRCPRTRESVAFEMTIRPCKSVTEPCNSATEGSAIQ